MTHDPSRMNPGAKKSFSAEEFVEALRKLAKYIEEVEELFEGMEGTTVVAEARGGKDNLSEAGPTCGASQPKEVGPTCGAGGGTDVSGDDEITAETICEVLKRLRQWLKYVENVICHAEKGKKLPRRKRGRG